MADHAIVNPDGKERMHPAQAEEIHTYRQGEEILSEGDHLTTFCVLLSGQVRLYQQGKKLRLLEEQDAFGLESVVFNRPCTYSARALTRARVATYGVQALDYFIRETPRMIRSLLTSTLHQLMQTSRQLAQDAELFSLEDVRVNFYSDGDQIIQEGTVGMDFFRLVSSQGGLKVTVQGKPVGRIEKPGEFFGEMAGLLHLPRQATVTSIGDSVVEAYSIDDLDIIIKDYPEIALQMMRTLVSRLGDVNRQLTGTAI
jgi:CRP-like cAMP-binding protein